MRQPKVVVMDFDGTLVNTMGGFAEVASGVLSKWYGTEPAVAKRQYIETSGIPFRQQVEILHPGDQRNDLAAREFEEKKLKGFFAESFAPETIETVHRLQERGLRVVVSSNNYQELVDAFCARYPLLKFDLVLGARENFFKGKDHFREVERVFRVGPKEMVFVGDSLKDGERAIGCGVPFIAKLGTFTREEFLARFPGIATIERLSELLELLPCKKDQTLSSSLPQVKG